MKKLLLITVLILSISLSACSRAPSDSVETDVKEPVSDIISPAPAQPEDTPFQPPVVQPHVTYEMTEDLFDFTVIIDGDVFKLPMSVDVFMAYGWEPVKDLDGTLPPYKETRFNTMFGSGFDFFRNDKYITVQLENMSDEFRYISDSTIIGLSSYLSNVEIELPHGIKLKTSSMDEVLAAFGEPNNINVVDRRYNPYQSLSYYTDDYSGSITIHVDDENDHISYIWINNRIQIDTDLISKRATIYNEITNKEESYITPVELGEDLTSFNIQIDGDLYRFPAPLSAFLNNGWEFDTRVSWDDPPEGIPAARRLRLYLVRGDISLYVDVFNFSDKLLALERCFVVRLDINIDIESVSSVVNLPGNINVGTKESVLSEYFETELYDQNTEYILTEYMAKAQYQFRPYAYQGHIDNTDAYDGITFYVDIEGENKGIITSISIVNVEF